MNRAYHSHPTNEVNAMSNKLLKDKAALVTGGSRLAVGCYGKPEEIASAVAYLASLEAAFVTGADLAVDGGFTA
jgi:hypothetical protein